jgi:N-acetylglucosaminyl-diphospho-decaprenol L-rhamnosyltransferase
MSSVPASQPAQDLCAVVLNYNSFEDTRACVASLLQLGIVPPRNIVVVDNASPDGSGPRLQNELAGIKVVLSPRNGGFAFGVNLGFAHAGDCAYYLVLNPDTRFQQNNLALALAEFERDPRLGVLGLNLVNPDGSLQYSARRFYSVLTVLLRRSSMGKWRMFRRLHDEHMMLEAWNGGAFDTDWIIGGGFIARRSAIDALGGFDEGYFLYVEDTDLCRRMWAAGWKVKAIPAVRLIHAHARASKGLRSQAAKYHLRSLYRYWRKFGLPLLGHGSRG